MEKEKKEIKRQTNSMDIVFLLDKSGSMSGCEKDTIGGYNSYINNQKGKNVKVTTVLFDNNYEMITKRESIENIKMLDEKTYYVGGSTSLMDAIGKTINYMDRQNPNKVIFIITTDGLENSSKEYTKEKIKELIKKHNDWEFMYLGADIDSYEEGKSIGINSKNISNYSKKEKGISKLFNALSKVSECFYEECEISANWKDELEEK